MEEILSICGLGVGIAGIVITISIFYIQSIQNNREKRIQELLKLQEEIKKCSYWCEEFCDCNWYNHIKFSKTSYELNHVVKILEGKIRAFKNCKFIYIRRYDEKVVSFLDGHIESMEYLIQALYIYSKFQNGFLEHYFGKGNPHDETGWDVYEQYCKIINNLFAGFSYGKQKLCQDEIVVKKELEKLKYKTNIIDIEFDAFDEKALETEVKKYREP